MRELGAFRVRDFEGFAPQSSDVGHARLGGIVNDSRQSSGGSVGHADCSSRGVLVRPASLMVGFVTLLACQGDIGAPAFRASGGGGGHNGVFTEDTPVPMTRTARLSHEQWENSVQDLLRLDAPSGLSSTFRNDPAQAGFLFGNNTETLEVDQALWGTYQRAAQQIAAQVAGDPAQIARLSTGAGATDEERARTLVTELGQRAHRRPLTEDEIDQYMAVWTVGSTETLGEPPFEAGVQLVIEAMLQSPFFLYRVEQSTREDDDVIPLDAWEVASRLSYLIWNTMPDDELFAAAADESLLEDGVVAEQVDRLLEDGRATDVVARFHEILFEADKAEGIAPSPAFFPDVSPQLGEWAVEEQDLFVRDLFERGLGVRELYTSTDTFVNAGLAEIYGVPGISGDELVPASLDPTQRAGILSHVAFLGGNSTSVNPDPIHRGVFVARTVSCIHIAAPPANVPPLPPLDGSMTNRQAVEAHTQQEGSVCANCHSTIINRFGFNFESYDAIGAWRTEDAGQAVDTATEPLIDGRNTPIANAVELANALAESRDVHDCYVKHWVEFAYGRPSADEDEPLVGRLGEQSATAGLSMRELFAGLATSRAFLTRSTEELP